VEYLGTYLNFIKYCQQPEGYFLNYVDQEQRFTEQNDATNLADANGRTIWALGYLLSRRALLPAALIATAEGVLRRALPRIEMMHSTRAMAFALKGLYYCNLGKKSPENSSLIKILADRLVQMYRHESEQGWQPWSNFWPMCLRIAEWRMSLFSILIRPKKACCRNCFSEFPN